MCDIADIISNALFDGSSALYIVFVDIMDYKRLSSIFKQKIDSILQMVKSQESTL